MEFLQNNHEWIFSGIGSSVIFWIIGYKQGYNKCLKQKMKVGDKGFGIQSGNDTHISIEGGKK